MTKERQANPAGMEAMRIQSPWVYLNLLGAMLVGGLVLLLATAWTTGVSRASEPALQPGQSATLLPSGQYLLLGGRGEDDQPSSEAWLFDPQTRERQRLSAKMKDARADHTATMLPDGRVLVLGGTGANGAVVASVESFDPEGGHFESAAGTNLTPRAGHAAAMLTDGRLFVIGGTGSSGTPIENSEIWNPRSRQVTVLPAEPPQVRSGASARLLADGNVLFAGGHDAQGQPMAHAVVFHPDKNRFLEISDADGAQFVSTIQQATVPQLAASVPIPGAGSFPIDGILALRFAGPVDVSTVNDRTIVLAGPQGQVACKIVPAQDGMLVFITPRHELIPGANYTLFVDDLAGPTGVKHSLEAIDFKTASQQGESAPQEAAHGGAHEAGGAVPGLVTGGMGPRVRAAAGMDAVEDDEIFVPDERHYGGRWRTGRPLPDQATALLDLDPRYRDKIAAQRARASRSGLSLTGVLPVTLKYPKGATGVAGLVLRLNDRPLANVSVSIGGHSTRTDENGRFELTGVASGHHVMLVDGNGAGAAGRRYAEFSYGVDVQAGQVTEITHAIYLPRVREKDWVNVSIPTRTDTIVTHPDIPGFEIHIPRGAVIRDRYGKIVNRIAIVPVPVDRTPFPLPENFPMYFMLQPSGAVVQGLDSRAANGIRVFYPNHTRARAGTEIRYWLYDPHERGWQVYGSARVSGDARQVVPDKGTYLPQNMLGGYGINNSKPGGKPTKREKCSGDPVDCSTGIFVHQRTDALLRDVNPLVLTRTYRTEDSYPRPFGIGASHEYEMYIYGPTSFSTGSNPVLHLVLPDGETIEYIKSERSDVLMWEQYSAPGRFYGSAIIAAHLNTGEAYSIKLRDGTLYQFDNSTGLLRNIAKPNGSRIEIIRNSGTIQRVITSNGRYLDFSYDIAGRITKMVDISGRTWTYTYNAAGYLSRATYPDNTYEEYTYDASGRMLTVRDRLGQTMVANVYDANGRVQQQTLADGGVFRFAYITDPEGRVTQTDITDPRGIVNRATFNRAGYLLTDTFALDRPEQQTVTVEREAGTNRVLSRTDTLGRTTAYAYDTRGNVTSVTRLAGTANAITETFAYEPLYSQMASYTNPLGKQTTFTHNDQGLLTRIRDPLGNETSLTYNGNGQIATHTIAGNTTRYAYDLGDLVSVIDPLNRTTGFYPDMLGRTLTVTDPALRRSHYEYNVLDQVTRVTDTLGNTTQMTYEPMGNLLTVTDAKGGVHQYTYDAKNRLAIQTDPLNQVERFQYDGNDNLTQYTDRKEQVTNFTYDPLNRRTLTTYADGSTVTSSYDAADRLAQASDSISGTITRGYDGLNRLVSETTPQGSVTYSYDTASRRTGMTVAGQPAITYGYDDANRITAITQGTTSVGFTYDSANRRASLTLPSGIVATYSYDATSQLTGITYTQGATPVGHLVYTYDALGNRTQTTGSLARTNLPAAITNATYNKANQLTNWNGTSITYDANGNMLSDGVRAYTWDARNRLASVSGPVTASFQYDAFGRRVQKTVADTNTRYLYDGLNPVQELNGSAPTANLLTGQDIDEFFSRSDSAGSRDFLTDALGTVLALADSAGAVQTSYAYEPFGNTTATGSPDGNPYQYTGRENDGTGLYYYRARYYHPGLQRFLSSDPIGLGGGLNTYAYVGNNPLRWVDPTGEAAQGAVPVIIGIGVLCARSPAACANAARAIGAGIGAAIGSKSCSTDTSKDDKPCKLVVENKNFLPPGKVRCGYRCPWYPGGLIVRIRDGDSCPKEVDWVPGDQGF